MKQLSLLHFSKGKLKFEGQKKGNSLNAKHSNGNSSIRTKSDIPKNTLRLHKKTDFSSGLMVIRKYGHGSTIGAIKTYCEKLTKNNAIGKSFRIICTNLLFFPFEEGCNSQVFLLLPVTRLGEMCFF